MKALVLESVGNLNYKEIPLPKVKPEEVLLKIKASGICNSDIDRVFKTGTYRLPLIPGHEFSGQVVSVGSNVSSEYLYHRFTVFPLKPCMKCRYCLNKEYARCEYYDYMGSRCDGGFAEYISVPVWNLVPISDTLGYELAAMCEPAAVALHGIDRASLVKGDSVLIQGAGTIGILTALWLKSRNLADPVMVIRSKQKLEFLRFIGINQIIDLSKETIAEGLHRIGLYGDIDVAFECVGSADAISTCIQGVKKGGRVLLFGNPTEDVLFSRDIYWKILRNELQLTGTWNSEFKSTKDNWIETIHAMEQGELDVRPLITHRFPLAKAKEGFRALMDKEEMTIKVILKTEEENE